MERYFRSTMTRPSAKPATRLDPGVLATLLLMPPAPVERMQEAVSQIGLAMPKSKPRAPEGGRNKPCQCGSGKKFKKCCGK